jgi:hypothetical protein
MSLFWPFTFEHIKTNSIVKDDYLKNMMMIGRQMYKNVSFVQKNGLSLVFSVHDKLDDAVKSAKALGW